VDGGGKGRETNRLKKNPKRTVVDGRLKIQGFKIGAVKHVFISDTVVKGGSLNFTIKMEVFGKPRKQIFEIIFRLRLRSCS
jgi:hypothetical protein